MARAPAINNHVHSPSFLLILFFLLFSLLFLPKFLLATATSSSFSCFVSFSANMSTVELPFKKNYVYFLNQQVLETDPSSTASTLRHLAAVLVTVARLSRVTVEFSTKTSQSRCSASNDSFDSPHLNGSTGTSRFSIRGLLIPVDPSELLLEESSNSKHLLNEVLVGNFTVTLDNLATVTKTTPRWRGVLAALEGSVCITAFNSVALSLLRNEMNEVGVASLSKSCMVPDKKKRQRTIPKEDVSDDVLPQDFIEQQRKYLAEIDAYELSEEEVASIDELD